MSLLLGYKPPFSNITIPSKPRAAQFKCLQTAVLIWMLSRLFRFHIATVQSGFRIGRWRNGSQRIRKDR